MTDTRTIFNFGVASVGAIATYLFGGWDLVIQILVAFMVLDVITGFIVGYINDELDSKVSFKGLLKKCLILIALIVAVLLDRLIGTEWTFRTVVCYFFIANEGLSILENIGKTGIELPQKLIKKLAQLKEGGNIDG